MTGKYSRPGRIGVGVGKATPGVGGRRNVATDVRSQRPGDRIQPFGMKGHKKISDILSDAKIPRIVRDEISVLTDDKRILWVIGVYASEIGRIGPKTSEIIKVQFKLDGCHVRDVGPADRLRPGENP